MAEDLGARSGRALEASGLYCLVMGKPRVRKTHQLPGAGAPRGGGARWFRGLAPWPEPEQLPGRTPAVPGGGLWGPLQWCPGQGGEGRPPSSASASALCSCPAWLWARARSLSASLSWLLRLPTWQRQASWAGEPRSGGSWWAWAGGGPSTGLEGRVGQLMAARVGEGGGRLGWPAGAGRGAPRAGVAAGLPCPAVRGGHRAGQQGLQGHRSRPVGGVRVTCRDGPPPGSGPVWGWSPSPGLALVGRGRVGRWKVNRCPWRTPGQGPVTVSLSFPTLAPSSLANLAGAAHALP